MDFLEGSFFKEPVVPLSVGTGKRIEFLKTPCVEDWEDHGAVFVINNKKRSRKRNIKNTCERAEFSELYCRPIFKKKKFWQRSSLFANLKKISKPIWRHPFRDRWNRRHRPIK